MSTVAELVQQAQNAMAAKQPPLSAALANDLNNQLRAVTEAGCPDTPPPETNPYRIIVLNVIARIDAA